MPFPAHRVFRFRWPTSESNPRASRGVSPEKPQEHQDCWQLESHVWHSRPRLCPNLSRAFWYLSRRKEPHSCPGLLQLSFIFVDLHQRIVGMHRAYRSEEHTSE